MHIYTCTDFVDGIIIFELKKKNYALFDERAMLSILS